MLLTAYMAIVVIPTRKWNKVDEVGFAFLRGHEWWSQFMNVYWYGVGSHNGSVVCKVIHSIEGYWLGGSGDFGQNERKVRWKKRV